MALLAKHIWKFLKEPNSLVSRVYNRKYFNGGSILDAKLGGTPLLIWRSVWLAKELMKEGLIWCVGNERQIKVWGQKWLPTPSSHFVQSPVLELGHEARVCDLILPGFQLWNESLINNHFCQEEADIICRIPISKKNCEYRLVWKYSKDSKYNVRSGYYVAKQLSIRREGESSKGGHVEELWKSMQKLHIPIATKHFLWRAGSNALPTKVVEDELGPICNMKERLCYMLYGNAPAMCDVWAKKGSALQK